MKLTKNMYKVELKKSKDAVTGKYFSSNQKIGWQYEKFYRFWRGVLNRWSPVCPIDRNRVGVHTCFNVFTAVFCDLVRL